MKKYNPQANPYRKHLEDHEIDTIIDKLDYGPKDLEKKVFNSRMCRDYGDLLEARIKQKAKKIPDMKKAQAWEREMLQKIETYSTPVPGYDYNERTASLVTTSRHKTLRVSRHGGLKFDNNFSGTFETADKLKKIIGYAAAVAVLGFALYCGHLLKNTIEDTEKIFNKYDDNIEQIIEKRH